MSTRPAGHRVSLHGAGSTATLTGTPVAAGALWSDQLSAASLPPLWFRPNLAVVLADRVRPGAGPGAVHLASAGTCLVLEVTDDAGTLVGLITDDRLLEPDADGELTCRSHASDPEASGEGSRTVPAAPDARIRQIRQLADGTDSLDPGQIVLPAPERPGERQRLRPGLWEIGGPGTALLLVRVEP